MYLFTKQTFVLTLTVLCIINDSCANTVSHVSPSSIPPTTQNTQNKIPISGNVEGTVSGTELQTVGHGAHEEHSGSGERFPAVVIDFERVSTPFIISMWIFCACLGKIGFHMTPKLSNVFPESCMLILLGIIIGLLLLYTNSSSVSPLTADVFFIYMLPPIILDAGYFMPNRLFFDHLGTILMLAVIGTIWNCMTIGISMYAINLTGLFGVDIPVLHMFLFSALISAVDPVAVLAVFEEIHVEEVLFILVFGESLLNDGVTVVLYHMFEGFSEIGEQNIVAQDIIVGCLSFFLVAFGGTLIGIIWGFMTAFITRFTHGTRVIEPVFILVMSYLAYLNAEIFHFSGILAITFCGIAMKNYTEQNMSQKSQTTVKYAMKMLASSSETIIFMFLGVSTVHDEHEWNTWFIFFTILFCSVYRVIGVLILSAVCNKFRVQKINFVQKFIMSYGGLRGAVAFALVLTIDETHIPLLPMFKTATISMVYFTVFIQGITIKPLTEILGVKKASNIKMNMNERLHSRVMDYIMAGIEDAVGKMGNYYIREKFKNFHNKYLTPWLVRDYKGAEPKILQTFSEIKMQEALDYMQCQGQSSQNIESLAAVLRKAYNVPGVTNLDTTAREWNLDVAELEYSPTARDLNDAKFHHLLSDEYKPVKNKHNRNSTYKRHAVKDQDLTDGKEENNHNMYLHTRHIIPNHHHHKHHKKNRKNENGSAAPTYQQNGSAIKLSTDYMAEVMRDNPGFIHDEDDNIITSPTDKKDLAAKRQSVKGPVMAETALPWKRYTEEVPVRNKKGFKRQNSTVDENDISPTVAETVLPWKREKESDSDRPLKQDEFPLWASNNDYVKYSSPTNTFLGQVTEKRPNIQDIFEKRNSSHSLYSRNSSQSLFSKRGSLKDDPMSSRRGSLKDDGVTRRRGSYKDDISKRGSFDEGIFGTNGITEQRISRDSSISDSLLNTAITEEEVTKSPNPGTREHVINMDYFNNEKYDPGDDTKF